MAEEIMNEIDAGFDVVTEEFTSPEETEPVPDAQAEEDF